MDKEIKPIVFLLLSLAFVIHVFGREPIKSPSPVKQLAEVKVVRARDLGVPFDGTPGKLNSITDVPGVEVGYTTLVSGEGKLEVGKGPVRTGFSKNWSSRPAALGGSIPSMVRWAGREPKGRLVVTVTA